MAYYGFQKEKNIDKSIIDWSSITKKISDDILEVKADRDKQRSDLEDTHMDQMSLVSKYSTGVDKGMNSFIMTESQSTRNFLSSIHKQMKTGAISVDQAKRIKQNVMDTWDNVSVATKTFQENAKRLGDSKGKANEALLQIMGLNADLNNKKVVYDPINGQGFYVDIDKKTGKVDMSTAKPVQAINAVQNQSKEYVDVIAETAALAKAAPKIKLAISGTTDISSALQSPSFRDYLKNATKAKLSSDERMASVGLDFLNMEYTVDGKDSSKSEYTYNKVVGYDSDGTPVLEEQKVQLGKINYNSSTGKVDLTPKQREAITEVYKNSIIAQLPREKSKQFVDPRAYKPTAGEAKAIDAVKLIDEFVYDGKFSSLKTALTESELVRKINAPDANGVIRVSMMDGKERTIETFDKKTNKPKNTADVGREISSIIEQGSVYANESKRKNRQYVPTSFEDQSFIVKGDLTQAEAKNFISRLSPTKGELGIGTAAPNSEVVKEAVVSTAIKLGIPEDKIKVSVEGGKQIIRYIENTMSPGEIIGTVGETAPSTILQEIRKIGDQSRSNKKQGY